MPPTTFPGRLRALRQAAGYTLEELGHRCGWSKARVHALEREGANPRRETIVTLAAALGCTLAELDPSLAIEVPEGVVVLVPDRDREGVFRPWREQDRAKVGYSVDHSELAALTTLLRGHGLGLYLLP